MGDHWVVDAESALLGAIMLDNSHIPLVVEEIGDNYNMFEVRAHQNIYYSIYKMYKENPSRKIDPVIVKEYLDKMGETIDGIPYSEVGNALVEAGGLDYIFQLWNAGSSFINVSSYLEVMRENYIKRRMARALNEAMFSLSDKESAVVIDGLRKSMTEISKDYKGKQLKRVDELMQSEILEIEKRINDGGITDKFSYCGLRKIDEIIGGFEPGQSVIIAARTSMGKTQFAATLAANFSTSGSPTLFFSLEMTSEEVARRILLSGTRISQSEIKNGAVAASSVAELHDSAKRYVNANLYIDDKAGLSVQDIARTISYMKREYGIKVVIIDYLQLIAMQSDDLRKGTVKITRELKRVAKDYGVCIIALSQLSREIEKRDSKEPRLSDLKESGSIEDDADIVMFLHRDSYYKNDPLAAYQDDKLKVIIAKHRNGRLGAPELSYDVARGTIKDREVKESKLEWWQK